jgi:hypothetical protein
VLFVAALIGAVAAGAVAYLAWPAGGMDGAASQPSPSAQAATPPGASEATPSTASAGADGFRSREAAAAAAGTSVQLEANAPIVQLRVEGRDPVLLAEPVVSMQLALRTDERKGPLTVRAVSKDGRKAAVVLRPTDTTAQIRFPDKPSSSPKGVRPRPKGATAPKDPGLAPSPYQHKP